MVIFVFNSPQLLIRKLNFHSFQQIAHHPWKPDQNWGGGGLHILCWETTLIYLAYYHDCENLRYLCLIEKSNNEIYFNWDMENIYMYILYIYIKSIIYIYIYIFSISIYIFILHIAPTFSLIYCNEKFCRLKKHFAFKR